MTQFEGTPLEKLFYDTTILSYALKDEVKDIDTSSGRSVKAQVLRHQGALKFKNEPGTRYYN